MYDRQYIAFSKRNPEKPELFSDGDALLKLLREEVAEKSYYYDNREYLKIVKIEIEAFASVAGRWEDVTEELYTLAEEKEAYRNSVRAARLTHYDNRRGY